MHGFIQGLRQKGKKVPGALRAPEQIVYSEESLKPPGWRFRRGGGSDGQQTRHRRGRQGGGSDGVAVQTVREVSARDPPGWRFRRGGGSDGVAVQTGGGGGRGTDGSKKHNLVQSPD